MNKSKTSRINECRRRILGMFNSYALHVRDWEPKKEGDYDDLEETINRILEEFVT
jgi:hypothetical protein